ILYVVAIALVALLVAIPLLPLWQTFENIANFRDYSNKTTSSLTALLEQEGPAAVAAVVKTEAGALPSGRFLVFADPGKKVLAGTLGVWPAAVPDVPLKAFPVYLDPGTKAPPVVVTHVNLPGGYHLLIGRNAWLQAVIQKQLLYGVAGALAILILFGTAAA